MKKILLTIAVLASTFTVFSQGTFTSSSASNANIEFNLGKYVQSNATDNIIVESIKLGDDIENAIMEDINNNKITLYPNPTSDILFFSSGIDKIVIFDATGKEVANNKLKNNTLNIKHLTRGVYYISLFNNNEYLESQKIIKN